MHRIPVQQIVDKVWRGDEKALNILEGARGVLGVGGKVPIMGWIAGGAVRRFVAGQPIEGSDIDLFFRDDDAHAVAKECFAKAGKGLVAKTDHTDDFLIPVQLPTEDGERETVEIRVQLVGIDRYSSVETLLDSFDFTICQFALNGDEVVAAPMATHDLLKRRLSLHKVTYGAATVRRMLKYGSQGFTICGDTCERILEECAEDPDLIQRTVQYVD